LKYVEGREERSPPKIDEEGNMERKVKWLCGMTVAAMLAGTCLLSPVKADVAAAQATYKAKCASCHGADGKGKEALKTQDLASAAVQNMSDAELTTIITDGKGKMPAYGKSLKPDQVKDLVAYIRSFAKK
jgi:mono/diheme cytochrome c family protein